jgi:hypothetical protein
MPKVEVAPRERGPPKTWSKKRTRSGYRGKKAVEAGA